jgi:nitrogenase molybdenum-iron protein alpha/beta subunit
MSKTNRIKNLWATALAVGICTTALGQTKGQEIHGVIRDALGEPIVGATIV